MSERQGLYFVQPEMKIDNIKEIYVDNKKVENEFDYIVILSDKDCKYRVLGYKGVDSFNILPEGAKVSELSYERGCFCGDDRRITFYIELEKTL